MRKPLILIAASGLAREALVAVIAAGVHDVVGILDDNSDIHHTVIDGVQVLGGIDLASGFPEVEFVVCVGSGTKRSAIVNRLRSMGVTHERFASVVHPNAQIPTNSSVGRGSVILANVVLTTNVTVGSHVVVMPGVVMTHDVRVDDFVTLCAGTVLGGGVRIGYRAYVGMSSSVRQNLTVGSGATVGMGSVVLTSIPVGETWVGVPAQELFVDSRRNKQKIPAEQAPSQ